MYWVCIQYIVKKFPDGLFLATPYVPIRDLGTEKPRYTNQYGLYFYNKFINGSKWKNATIAKSLESFPQGALNFDIITFFKEQ